MNLKEAFRFQNKIQALMDEGGLILSRDQNLTQTKNTYLRSKVMQDAEDETVTDQAPSEFADRITDVAGFMLFLLGERKKLSKAIRKAKNELEIDFDGETSLNTCRQSLAHMFKHMADLRASEVIVSNSGYGYRFNTDGNQVSYKCDVRRVTTINFDRNTIRKELANLNKQSDAVSAELDRCLVNSSVDYDPPFDVNDSFTDVFESFSVAKASA